jgi:hypothetical protein
MKMEITMPIKSNKKTLSHEFQFIIKRLNEHCDKIKRLADGFEMAQDGNPNFSINQPFDPNRSSMTRTVLINIVKTYKAIRNDLQKITQMKDEEFRKLFPELDINFETYYSVALSLLNLTYQMQYMKIYCRRLLSPDIL